MRSGVSSDGFLAPHSCIVRMNSSRRISSALFAPGAPAAATPNKVARPNKTALAPRAIALAASAPRRMPPSSITGIRPPTAATTSGKASSVPIAPSSWRPPWLETTMASHPSATARCASSPRQMPLTISLRGQRSRTWANRFQSKLGS